MITYSKRYKYKHIKDQQNICLNKLFLAACTSRDTTFTLMRFGVNVFGT